MTTDAHTLVHQLAGLSIRQIVAKLPIAHVELLAAQYETTEQTGRLTGFELTTFVDSVYANATTVSQAKILTARDIAYECYRRIATGQE